MLAPKLDIRTEEIYTCLFAPDGTRALTGAQGNPVTLWDLTSGRPVRNFEHTGPVWALAWSSNQRLFISLDGTMRLWDVDTSRCLREYEGRHVRSAAWSSDGRRVLSGSNGVVQLTDLESGRCLHTLEGHRDGVYTVAFDLNQQRALSGSRDRTVRAWDLDTGRCTRVLEGHTYHVQESFGEPISVTHFRARETSGCGTYKPAVASVFSAGTGIRSELSSGVQTSSGCFRRRTTAQSDFGKWRQGVVFRCLKGTPLAWSPLRSLWISRARSL